MTMIDLTKYVYRLHGEDSHPAIDPRWNENDLKASALYAAWKARDLEKTIALIDEGVNIDVVNCYGETILHQACHHGSIEFVEMLVEKGADINARNVKDYTPLHRACDNHRFKVIEYLIEKDADISALTDDGSSIWKCLVDDCTFNIKGKNTLLERKKQMVENYGE